MYADIIIDITHEKLDKVFQYSIPSELEGILEVGTEVIVPFDGETKKPVDILSVFLRKRIMTRRRLSRFFDVSKRAQPLSPN